MPLVFRGFRSGEYSEKCWRMMQLGTSPVLASG
jgi:hypothetical protein